MKLNFEKMGGLIPAIVQDENSKDVLMLGFMNQDAWDITQRTRKVTFWSRTRQQLWTKGETSGNYLEVVKIYSDCDNDAILIMARPHGPTCHTGKKSCFFNEIES